MKRKELVYWSKRAEQWVQMFDDAKPGETVRIFDGELDFRIWNQLKLVVSLKRAVKRDVKITVIAGPVISVGPRPTKILVFDTPPGDAPEDIRKAWNGLILPIAQLKQTPGQLFIHTHDSKLENVGGYAVFWKPAIKALRRKNRRAAKWWTNEISDFGTDDGFFSFSRNVCAEVF